MTAAEEGHASAASMSAAVRGNLGELARRAAAAYFATAALMVGLTLASAVSSAVIAASWLHVVLVVLAALAVGTALGVALAAKRAVVTTIVFGLEKLELGSRLTQVVFDRLVAVDDEEVHGERGGQVTQKLERIPLAVAEARLRRAVDGLVRDPGEGRGVGAWLSRKIRRALLERIELITLQRLRAEDQTHGGVNVVVVKGEVAAMIDGALIEHFQGGAKPLAIIAVATTLVAPIGLAIALNTWA